MKTAAIQQHARTVSRPAAGSEVMMRAVVATGYGSPDVLEFADVAKPTPTKNELLIRVRVAGVSAADSMMRRGDPAYARLFLGLRKPKAQIPGTGFSGVVEAVGSGVTRFKVGDDVFGESGTKFGAHAHYVCVPEDGVIVPKPANLSFEQAATMCDGPMTSFNFLKRIADVQPGQKVLVNGASGSLGSAAVQLAKSFGAEVTGVCSTANLEFVKSLGADHVLDYTAADFTTNQGRSDRYDVIYDTVGVSSYRQCKNALTKTGIYMSPVLSFRLLLQMLWTAAVGSRSAKFDATGLRPAAQLRPFLAELIELHQTGALRCEIEKVYRFDQLTEAHAHIDTGRKRGSVVVRI